MSSWEVAPSLVVLRREVNGVWPQRDRTSDGSIGDVAHSARSSKHNPGPDRLVEALDFDEDIQGTSTVGTRPLWALVQHCVQLGRSGFDPLDGPGAHLIYEGRIWSHAKGWVERHYSGLNAHEHHAHIAVVDGKGKLSTAPWGVEKLFLPKAKKLVTIKPDRWLGLSNPPMVGHDIRNLHNALIKLDPANRARLGADYELQRYGELTRRLVEVFKNNRGIKEAGFGPECYRQIRKEIH